MPSAWRFSNTGNRHPPEKGYQWKSILRKLEIASKTSLSPCAKRGDLKLLSNSRNRLWNTNTSLHQWDTLMSKIDPDYVKKDVAKLLSEYKQFVYNVPLSHFFFEKSSKKLKKKS